MSVIAPAPREQTPAPLYNAAKSTNGGWATVTANISELIGSANAHPARTVVLLPYAQLIDKARAAWVSEKANPDRQNAKSAGEKSFFVPRFETTFTWAKALPGFVQSPHDLHMDAAVDTLTARGLLARAGVAQQGSDLAGLLVEAAWSLAGVAAAQPPVRRVAWGDKLAADLSDTLQSRSLALEGVVARVALAWVATSGYATDPLFTAQPELLILLEGFQSDPLTQSLKAQFGQRAIGLPLAVQLASPATGQPTEGALTWRTAPDFEAEAQLAAACVLAQLSVGSSPVALVAQDRKLTRRVGALLSVKGVAVRDETGWKLSTTRAAATLMGLLRALPWDASTDAVVDWLKNAPAFQAPLVSGVEAALRKVGMRFWRAVPNNALSESPELAALVARVNLQREVLARSRSLADWQQGLGLALQAAGQWLPLANDAAGQAVLAALHMDTSADAQPDSFNDSLRSPHGELRLSLRDFVQWVQQALEAGNFMPPLPADAHLVVLPLSQLLGREFAAVVLPGCDELRFAVSPEPPGAWTPQQRAMLGLPSRQELDQVQRAAWQHALTAPQLDLLWRTSDGGERLMPNGFVQELQLKQHGVWASDPRPQRAVTPAPIIRPQPTGQALAIQKLSASAYEDLRRCPYRFFALRQLRLQEADEMQTDLDKRDFGNWLHLLLNSFQNALQNQANSAKDQDFTALTAMLNVAAEEAMQALGLSAEEFLPFAAIWPRVREGYLSWLVDHQASGASYLEGEVWKTMPLGKLELVGKIDRIDQLADGSKLVVDYKTEAEGKTKERIKEAGEDTQLAFYAALFDDDTLAAAYVNLGEKQPTKTYPQPDIVALRDDLISGILSDMERIANGAPLPALGEGTACDFCAARGLCRKDFWS